METGNEEYFSRESSRSPSFVGRMTLCGENYPPARVYVHASGLVDAFSIKGDIKIHPEITGHAIVAILNNPDLIKDSDYLIAAVWGEEGNKMVDLAAYSGTKKDWSSNSVGSFYILVNGVYVPERRDLLCEDDQIVLGAEGIHRRTTQSLAEFLRTPPKIPGLKTYTKSK